MIIKILSVIVILSILISGAWIGFYKNAPKCNSEEVSDLLNKLSMKEVLTIMETTGAKGVSGRYTEVEEINQTIFPKESRMCKAKYLIKNNKTNQEIVFATTKIEIKIEDMEEPIDLMSKPSFTLKDINLFDDFLGKE